MRKWYLKFFSIVTILFAILFPVRHVCKPTKYTKTTETEIPIQEDLGCNHKTFVFGFTKASPLSVVGLTNAPISGDVLEYPVDSGIIGLTNAPIPSGDFLDCPTDGWVNG